MPRVRGKAKTAITQATMAIKKVKRSTLMSKMEVLTLSI